MTDYRVYFMSAEGHIARADDIACVTDGAALWQARTLRHVHPVEIWQGTRLVGTVPGALMEPDQDAQRPGHGRWAARLRLPQQLVTA